jgi:tripartite-type tricarboxylate transporter receptor subunit TctC
MRPSVALVGALLLMAIPARAEFPDRPIRVIVPQAAGGASDLIARLLGEGAAPALGQPIIVENRTGANGITGMDAVAKSDKDGYTLGLCAVGSCATNPLFNASPYDVKRDLQPVFWAASLSNVLVVKDDGKIKSFDDFVQLARSKQLTYGSSGIGSAHHLGSELLAKALGVNFLQVPYRGGAPAMTGLLAGDVDFMIENISTVVGSIQPGQLRGLAVTSNGRSPRLPDIPTFPELGHDSVVIEPWFGFVVPTGTPEAVVKKLNGALDEALRSSKVSARFKDLDLRPEGGNVVRFGDHITSEIEKWRLLVMSRGIGAAK